MNKIRLGRTDLMVTKSSFGALPIQRLGFDEAKDLLRRAYESGINFFDTARLYTDSEEKIGNALCEFRKDIIIATKTHAKNRKELFQQLETSLMMLKTDYIDIFQLHFVINLPDPHYSEGLYQALIDAKKQGMIRFFGITSHRPAVTIEAAKSGLYDTVQSPLNLLSSNEELKLVEVCKKHDIGLIAMKPMSGGLLSSAASAFVFLGQYDNVVPIWGIQKVSELDEFLALEKNPPLLDQKIWRVIKKDRVKLSGQFCRGCGYCLPCSVEIPIDLAARMALFLKRSLYQRLLKDKYKEKMERIEECIECGLCKKRCPYGLDIPNLLKDNLAYYREFYNKHT